MPATPVGTFNSFKPDPNLEDDKDKGKGKEVAKEVLKGQKKCFKCHGLWPFSSGLPQQSSACN